MGTNYYHRYNICLECGRYETRHIGKNSIGWQFSFRAYQSKNGIFIVSWSHWKNVLQKGKIFDEYNREFSYQEFVKKVEAKKGQQNHYDYIKNHPVYGSDPYTLKGCFKDNEGWDFSFEGFS